MTLTKVEALALLHLPEDNKKPRSRVLLCADGLSGRFSIETDDFNLVNTILANIAEGNAVSVDIKFEAQ